MTEPKPLSAEALRDLFRQRGWAIVMDDREGQPMDPFEDLAALCSPTPASPEALREQGATMEDIDARLARGYAGFKQPLMVAVADVSTLRAALAASPAPAPADES